MSFHVTVTLRTLRRHFSSVDFCMASTQFYFIMISLYSMHPNKRASKAFPCVYVTSRKSPANWIVWTNLIILMLESNLTKFLQDLWIGCRWWKCKWKMKWTRDATIPIQAQYGIAVHTYVCISRLRSTEYLTWFGQTRELPSANQCARHRTAFDSRSKNYLLASN